MGKLVNLTLLRRAPGVARAGRGPSGRVARVMAYFLAHGRGPANARTALDYLRDVEPELISELRDDLLALPEAERHDELDRRVAKLRRLVGRAIGTCRGRWGVPLAHLPADGCYLDVPDEPAHPQDLWEARRGMPRDVATRFEAALERLVELAQRLDDGTDAEFRAIGSGPASRALRRWGVRPRVFGPDDESWELRTEYNRLLARLTGAARRWQPSDGAETGDPAGARNG